MVLSVQQKINKISIVPLLPRSFMRSPPRTGSLHPGQPLLSMTSPTVILYSLQFKCFKKYSEGIVLTRECFVSYRIAKSESKLETEECCNTKNDKCCCGEAATTIAGNNKCLKIDWQRLISNEETCPRCGSTEDEIERAVIKLKKSLAPLGIDVFLEKKGLSVAEFKKAPLQSNRIWLNNEPLEEIIDASIGQSPCCDICGPSNCRTITVDSQEYETVPSEVIVKAGLIVATQLVGTRNEVCC